MGEAYRNLLKEKIKTLKGIALRVYVNPDGVSPHYRGHLEDTFKTVGATFVSTREDANFVFEGICEPQHIASSRIVAFFKDGQLRFSGTLDASSPKVKVTSL